MPPLRSGEVGQESRQPDARVDPDVDLVVREQDDVRPGVPLVEKLPTGERWERVPAFEAVATTGAGVFDTLKAVSKLVVRALG